MGTIVDDEPRISINDVTVTEGNTGTVNATFTVSLSVAYDVAVTVHYQTANGTATAGSDYAAASGDVTIAAGQTTKTITVAVIGDRSAEPTETFVVNLTAASNGLFVDSQGVGTILDNEPRISISDVTKKEGKKSQTTLFTFTVTLSAAYDQAVTMSFQHRERHRDDERQRLHRQDRHADLHRRARRRRRSRSKSRATARGSPTRRSTWTCSATAAIRSSPRSVASARS